MTNKFETNKTQKTVAQTNVTTQANADGEITRTSTEQIFKLHFASEPRYIKQYQQDFDAFNALKKSSKEILHELLTYTTYNENRLYLNIEIKKAICKKLGLSYTTMTNALTELKQSQIILYLNTGSYVVNPYYYGVGEWPKLKDLRNKIEIKIQSKKVNDKTIEIYTFEYQQLKDQFIDKTKIEKAKPKKTTSIADAIKKEKRKRKRDNKNKVNLKNRLGNFMKIFKNKNSNIQS